jgi:hypothetical protein
VTTGSAIDLARCTAVFREWLHMPDAGALHVTLATVAANRAPGDPVWTLLVGPPGGGKTEILKTVSRLPDVHLASTMTEAALLSGTPKRDQAPTATGGLLREIGDAGIIVLKDFGSVLSMHRDPRAAVLAALREIYDGSWTRRLGTDGGKTLSWSGKVGLIAGVTPAIDGHHAVMGSMGERFVLFRLPPTDGDAQARQALGHVGREGTMRQALTTAAQRVLSSVEPGLLTAAPDERTQDRLISISTLAVRCRSAVERDGYTREVLNIPEPEAPARLALVLLRLWNGLLAIGVDDREAWSLVTKCALDSMPAVRRLVVEDLMRRSAPTGLAEIAERINYPPTTTRRALEDLGAHGIAARQAPGHGAPDSWMASDWARSRWPSVPEKSAEASSEHETPGATVPFSLPLRTDDDISGTPPSDPTLKRAPSAGNVDRKDDGVTRQTGRYLPDHDVQSPREATSPEAVTPASTGTTWIGGAGAMGSVGGTASGPTMSGGAAPVTSVNVTVAPNSCPICGHGRVEARPGRFVCTYWPGHLSGAVS